MDENFLQIIPENIKINESGLNENKMRSANDDQDYQLHQDKKTLTTYTGEKYEKAEANIKLKSLDKIIDTVMADKNELLQAKPSESTWVPLKHKRSRTLLKDGHNTEEIVEFLMGGSGFKEFRNKEHKGSHGKGKIEALQKQEVELDILDEDNQKIKFKPAEFGILTKLWSGIKALFSDKAAAVHNAKLRAVRQYEEKQKEMMEEIYGKSVVVGGKLRKHVKERVKTEKGVSIRKYNIAGTQEGGGTFNRGEYSIENNIQYMKELGQQRIDDWISKYGESNDNPKELRFILRGHSRGAVAALEGAMLIKQYALDCTKDDERLRSRLLSSLKFELIQHDPVPGYGSDSGVNEYANLSVRNKRMKDEGMAALGGNLVESTLFYSLHTEHDSFFTPQKVIGAKRVILTPYRHMVGLDEIENTTTSEKGKVEYGKHSQTWFDSKTKIRYRGAGISELPEGLYIQKSNGELVRMEDAKTAIDIYRAALEKEDKKDKQVDRHNLIEDVINNYFGISHKDREQLGRILDDQKVDNLLSLNDEQQRLLDTKDSDSKKELFRNIASEICSRDFDVSMLLSGSDFMKNNKSFIKRAGSFLNLCKNDPDFKTQFGSLSEDIKKHLNDAEAYIKAATMKLLDSEAEIPALSIVSGIENPVIL